MNRIGSAFRVMVMGALVGAAGCAPTMPTARQEASAGAIRAAEEVGAPRVPQAALHLQLAKEQSERAKQLISSGDKDGANALLMRAESDAELAVALVREDNERAAATQAVDNVKQLQKSIQ